MKNLSLILLASTVLACSPPETDTDLCIDNIILILDIEHYSGEMGSECRSYLRWFTHDGSDYFMMDNPCADIALHLWDCEKVDVCQDNSLNCQEIVADMTAQGIVGKSKE